MSEYRTDRCTGSFMLDPNGDREHTQIGPYVYLQTNATYLRPGRPQLAEMLEAYAFHLRAQHTAFEAKVENDPTRFNHAKAYDLPALYVLGAQCLDVDIALLQPADSEMVVSFGQSEEDCGGTAWCLTPEQGEFRIALYKRIDRHMEWHQTRCECSLCRPKDNGGLRHL